MPSELSRSGIVRSVRDGIAVVTVDRGGCSACGEKSGCTIGRLAGDRKASLIEVAATTELSIGEEITLELPQNALHRAALIGYLLPAVMLVSGAVMGQTTSGNDLGAAIGAGLGLLVGMSPGLLLFRRRQHADVRIKRKR